MSDQEDPLTKNDTSDSARDNVNNATKLLTAHLDFEHDSYDSSSDNDASEGHLSDDALTSVQFAATQRKDLDRSSIRDARQVETTNVKESLHNVPSTVINQKKLMQKMMKTLHAEDPANTKELSKRVKKLYSRGNAAVAEPLPEPVQNRLQRGEAYKQATGTISKKWARTVARNRHAQQLVFPLNAPGRDVNRTGGIPQLRKRDYEEEIDELLKEAGVEDKAVSNNPDEKVGDLEYATTNKEEIIRKKREQAKVRSVMFHYEQKMKRIKKIKSRKYRRMMKKDKEKLENAMEDDEQDIERAERERIVERTTLRHKNTSKWIKRQLQRKEGRRNENARAAIEDQLKLHEELRRRQGTELENTLASDSEDDSDSDAEQQMEREQNDLEEELQKPRPKQKGIMGMRFMREAEERKRQEALSLLKSIIKTEDGVEPKDEESGTAGRVKADIDENEEEEEEFKTQAVQFSSGEKDLEYPDDAIQANEGEGLSILGRIYTGGFRAEVVGRLAADDNPWLKEIGTSTKVIKESARSERTKRLSPTRKNKMTAEKVNYESGNGYSGKKRSRFNVVPDDNATSQGKNAESNEETIPAGGIGSAVSPPENTKETSENSILATIPRRLGQTASINAVAQDQEEKRNPNELSSEKPKWSNVSTILSDTQEQGEIERMQGIAEAFAGAGGAELADFEATKEAEIERDMPTAKSLQAEVLPGWGSWDGAGMNPKRRKKESTFARAARERLEAARAAAKDKRKDRNMRHVILDQRRIKQTTDLTLSSLPFPFNKRENWEREVNNPLNKELVSGAAFKNTLKKRIVAKPGTVINPIKFTGGEQGALRHRGKRGVIDLRKSQSRQRSKARRGLMS